MLCQWRSQFVIFVLFLNLLTNEQILNFRAADPSPVATKSWFVSILHLSTISKGFRIVRVQFTMHQMANFSNSEVFGDAGRKGAQSSLDCSLYRNSFCLISHLHNGNKCVIPVF